LNFQKLFNSLLTKELTIKLKAMHKLKSNAVRNEVAQMQVTKSKVKLSAIQISLIFFAVLTIISILVA